MDDFSINMKNMLVKLLYYYLMLMIYVKYYEIIDQHKFLYHVHMFDMLMLKDY
jgi:hypothetical protein